ncbi:hypothetical protein A2911_02710 [Candidatus Nomurabacteria bacterium RIFCSPLOWO2_01_FULL_40_15]|uniref:NADAR domain-containing protein n=1 Tax=Candidatus Nomurabacteria bacterium RIFCSPLOWO2_01_FULL_40_15 TaxID=1801772 RepID=A0A1F6X900_9BACT|nr:MAG: hypothetical protein A2911_02710 [Candidatus Nomurabacteria bacterium RIFCSPLOWO2_01_FULL_40_15]
MENNSQDFNKETNQAVYFFTPPHYALDNFSAFSVEIWGKLFMTSEHAYQWKKYHVNHLDIAEEIFTAGSSHQVKKISDANKDKVSSDFHKDKIYIMEEILRVKLQQHEKVQRTLKETGSKEIIENNPNDEFWGIGSGNGQNMLGKIWMKIRDN